MILQNTIIPHPPQGVNRECYTTIALLYGLGLDVSMIIYLEKCFVMIIVSMKGMHIISYMLLGAFPAWCPSLFSYYAVIMTASASPHQPHLLPFQPGKYLEK